MILVLVHAVEASFQRCAVSWWLPVTAVILSCVSCLAAPALIWKGAPTNISNDGVVVFEFSKHEDESVELQLANRADFSDAVVLYRGTDPSTVRTGLAEGHYYFRLRTDEPGGSADWSERVAVEVKYLPRSQLYLLLATGFVMVGMIVVAILAGRRDVQKQDRAR